MNAEKVFNSNLAWDDHKNSLVAQTYIKLRALCHTQLAIPLNTRILIAKTYLIPGCLIIVIIAANEVAMV